VVGAGKKGPDAESSGSKLAVRRFAYSFFNLGQMNRSDATDAQLFVSAANP
jgi:hypothetical protein